jgi:predicted lysophospholipase L1 biosynthesis ABC-type transport system permease subunit
MIRGVDWGDREDSLPEWRASNEQPRGQWLAITLVFGLPVVALLIGGVAGSAWGAAMIGVFVVAAVVVGTIDSWRVTREAGKDTLSMRTAAAGSCKRRLPLPIHRIAIVCQPELHGHDTGAVPMR